MRPALPDVDVMPVVPSGMLRILARNDDAEILILHGTDREVGQGERLAWTEQLPSVEVAIAMSHFCSGRLIMCQFPPDSGGWHPFKVIHLKTLLADARNNLNVTYFPPPAIPRERQEWTKKRCAWLAVLITRGWTAKRIAADPLIRSTAGMVYKKAHELGLSFSTAPSETGHLRLPVEIAAAYDRAADRAGLTRDAYIRRHLIEAAPRLNQLVAA